MNELVRSQNIQQYRYGAGSFVEDATSPTENTQRRKRWEVTGAPGVEFNDSGEFFKYRHKLSFEDAPAPLIDLGHEAKPMARRAFDDGTRLWFADEIVCAQVYGPLPYTLQRYIQIAHLDGDWRNCAPTNLQRAVDSEYSDMRLGVQHLMRSRTPAKRGKHVPFAYSSSRYAAPRISEVPDWGELSQLQWLPKRMNIRKYKQTS